MLEHAEGLHHRPKNRSSIPGRRVRQKPGGDLHRTLPMSRPAADPIRAAMEPLYEAGEGEEEGWELAEAELIENAAPRGAGPRRSLSGRESGCSPGPETGEQSSPGLASLRVHDEGFVVQSRSGLRESTHRAMRTE